MSIGSISPISGSSISSRPDRSSSGISISSRPDRSKSIPDRSKSLSSASSAGKASSSCFLSSSKAAFSSSSGGVSFLLIVILFHSRYPFIHRALIVLFLRPEKIADIAFLGVPKVPDTSAFFKDGKNGRNTALFMVSDNSVNRRSGKAL